MNSSGPSPRQPTKINVSCGQTDLYPGCLKALGQQLGTPIYYPPYWELEIATIDMLQVLFNTKSDILLMEGCATYGGEAALLSSLEAGEKALFVITGKFGQVWCDVAVCLGIETVELVVEPGDTVDAEQIEAALRADPDIKLVSVVHVETSMGTTNPIAAIGERIRSFPDTLYFVDAVSSLGAVPVNMDESGIDICLSSPQKCINAPQGLALLAVSEKGWHKVETRKTPIPSLCLDLTVWRQYHQAVRAACEAAGEGREVRDVSFAGNREAKAAHGPSPSYVLVKALKASLEEIFDEGLELVFRRHRTASRAVREAVRALGLGLEVKNEAAAAPVCTKIVWPEGLDRGKLGQWMQENYGVALGGDRIGNMGFVASSHYMLPVIHALEMGLRAFGIQVPLGKGVEAARRIFAEAEEV